LSFTDEKKLKCYKINGTTEIIEKGPIHGMMAKEIDSKLIRIIAHRIAEEVHNGKHYESLTTTISKKFVVYKVKLTKTEEMSFREIHS